MRLRDALFLALLSIWFAQPSAAESRGVPGEANPRVTTGFPIGTLGVVVDVYDLTLATQVASGLATTQLTIDAAAADAWTFNLATVAGYPTDCSYHRYYIRYAPTIATITGTTGTASPTITAMANTLGVAVGQAVYGTGIPSGEAVVSCTPNCNSASAGTVTMTTGTNVVAGTNTITFATNCALAQTPVLCADEFTDVGGYTCSSDPKVQVSYQTSCAINATQGIVQAVLDYYNRRGQCPVVWEIHNHSPTGNFATPTLTDWYVYWWGVTGSWPHLQCVSRVTADPSITTPTIPTVCGN